MIQLSSVLLFAVVIFAVIGYLRGFDKEIICTAGVVLAIFTLVQFEPFLADVSDGASNPPATLFYIQALILLVITFFAYQTPPERFVALRAKKSKARDIFQTRALGLLTGAFNGYLVFGSLWYFLDTKNYPLRQISPPPLGSTSADFVGSLPLAWLLQGNLLTLLVIGLFLYILIAII